MICLRLLTASHFLTGVANSMSLPRTCSASATSGRSAETALPGRRRTRSMSACAAVGRHAAAAAAAAGRRAAGGGAGRAVDDLVVGEAQARGEAAAMVMSSRSLRADLVEGAEAARASVSASSRERTPQTAVYTCTLARCRDDLHASLLLRRVLPIARRARRGPNGSSAAAAPRSDRSSSRREAVEADDDAIEGSAVGAEGSDGQRGERIPRPLAMKKPSAMSAETKSPSRRSGRGRRSRRDASQ